jgi:hypothetical protein
METLKKLVISFFRIMGLIMVILLIIIAFRYLGGNQVMGASFFSISYPPPDKLNLSSKLTTPYPIPMQSETPGANNPPMVQIHRIQITPTAPAIADDGWYIYSDSESGYSFHYPPNSNLTSGKGPRVPYTSVILEYIVPNERSYHGMTIMVKPNPSLLSSQEFAGAIYKELVPSATAPQNLTANATTVRISNIQALKVVIPPTMADFTLLLPVKNKMIVISPTGDPIIQDDPVKSQALEIFNKIMLTFQITP